MGDRKAIDKKEFAFNVKRGNPPFLNGEQTMSKSIDSFFNDEENSASAKERAVALGNLRLNSSAGEISLNDKLKSFEVLEKQLRQQHMDSGTPLPFDRSAYSPEMNDLRNSVIARQIKALHVDKDFLTHMITEKFIDPNGMNGEYLRDAEVNPDARKILIEFGADAERAKKLDQNHLTYQLINHVQEVNDLRESGKAADYNVKLIDSLIRRGADVNGKYHLDSDYIHDYDNLYDINYRLLEKERRYPVACQIQDRDVFEHLIENHVTDLNFENEQSPLVQAVAHNDLSKAQYLIDQGSSIDLSPQFHGRGLDFWCSSSEMTELLGEHGFDFNHTTGEFSAPPLTTALERVERNLKEDDHEKANKNIAVIETMIRFGADINATNRHHRESPAQLIEKLGLSDHFKDHLKTPTRETQTTQRKQQFIRGFAQ